MKKISEGFKAERLISFEKLKRSIGKENISITDIGFFPNTEYHYVQREQGADENIMIFCSNGYGYIDTGRKIKLEKNEFFIIPKDRPHRYYSSQEDPWSIYWVHYSENEKEILLKNQKYPVKEKELQTLIKSLFSQMINVLEFGINDHSVSYSNFTLEFLQKSIVFLPKVYEKNIDKILVTEISKARNFIEENIYKKIRLEDLEKHLNCSKTSVNKLFKDEYQMSPLEYVMERKLFYAEKLLCTTLLSVSEIGEKIGFSDPLYFSKCFKKKYRYSPSLYRNYLKTKKVLKE